MGREHLEDLSVAGGIILEWTLEKKEERVWNWFTWFGRGTSGRLLWTW